MALAVNGFRLVRFDLAMGRAAHLSMVFAVRLDRDRGGVGRDAARARSRHGERGDGQGDDGDDSGPQTAHGANYVVTTLNVK